MEIVQEEEGSYYIKKGFFWNPTSASITRVTEEDESTIFWNEQQIISYNARPKIDYYNGKIRIHFRRGGFNLRDHVFYRYIMDDNDSVLPHYHSWYYYEDGGAQEGYEADI